LDRDRKIYRWAFPLSSPPVPWNGGFEKPISLQLRQFCHIGRDAPSLIPTKQLCRRSPPRLLLEKDMRQLCPALSITTKQASLNFSRDQGGRKTALRPWGCAGAGGFAHL
jgi:hypothetical protein